MNLQHSQIQQPMTQATNAMKTLNNHLLTASLTLAALTGASQAGTINWGGAFFTTNYSADGTNLESGPTAEVASGEVMFELGVFQNADGSEFTPSFENGMTGGCPLPRTTTARLRRLLNTTPKMVRTTLERLPQWAPQANKSAPSVVPHPAEPWCTVLRPTSGALTVRTSAEPNNRNGFW